MQLTLDGGDFFCDWTMTGGAPACIGGGGGGGGGGGMGTGMCWANGAGGADWRRSSRKFKRRPWRPWSAEPYASVKRRSSAGGGVESDGNEDIWMAWLWKGLEKPWLSTAAV